MECNTLKARLDGAALKHMRVDAFKAAQPDAARPTAIDRAMVGAAGVPTGAAPALVALCRAWPSKSTLASAAWAACGSLACSR